MRKITLFMGLVAVAAGFVGCGAPLSTTLTKDQQSALCTPLALQAAGEYACRESELSTNHADSGKPLYYSAMVEFDADGRVYKFRDLRALVGLTAQPLEVPECVVGTLQRLRVPERAEAVRLPIALTYTTGASPGAQLRADGTCTLIIPPAGL